jgi:hypothetical protein
MKEGSRAAKSEEAGSWVEGNVCYLGLTPKLTPKLLKCTSSIFTGRT